VLARGNARQLPIQGEIKQCCKCSFFSVDGSSQMSTIIETFPLRLITELAGRATDVLQCKIELLQGRLAQFACNRHHRKRGGQRMYDHRFGFTP
jgi:hypothetical protein